MTLAQFNQLGREKAAKELFDCCGSRHWVTALMEEYPFASERAMVDKATGVWYTACGPSDWLESFGHHPQIGDKNSMSLKFAGKEQAAVTTAPDELIDALVKGNLDYHQRFGFIFIVCATGKGVAEMLRLLQNRLKNNPDDEIRVAMAEQHKITLLRFKKLLSDANFQFLKMSQLTTHVLDTSIGSPGKNIAVKLLLQDAGSWKALTQGITDADGRISDLLPPETCLPPGNYKLVFDTGSYFASINAKGFYPEVEIQFMVTDQSHYHVPLLISPFGYSTYRGS